MDQCPYCTVDLGSLFWNRIWPSYGKDDSFEFNCPKCDGLIEARVAYIPEAYLSKVNK
jgi:hypothetical protein